MTQPMVLTPAVAASQPAKRAAETTKEVMAAVFLPVGAITSVRSDPLDESVAGRFTRRPCDQGTPAFPLVRLGEDDEDQFHRPPETKSLILI